MISAQKWSRLIEYIYEDDNVVVVGKPSGLLSIQDRYKEETPNLKQLLLNKYGAIYTVHRIDRDTSGVMIFARDEATHKKLNEQFTNREVDKTYWAFVNGQPPIEEGLIDMPILNEMKNAGRMFANAKGKPASTKFKLVENYGKISLMAFKPITGRTHQIRVHSHYIGCPLLVDTLYANASAFLLSSVKRKFKHSKWEEEKPLVSRLTLHAKELTLQLPSGAAHTFEAKLPKDLSALRKQLLKL